MVMVEGLATTLHPEINMWDVSGPFVKAWIRDELGPEAMIADRLRTDAVSSAASSIAGSASQAADSVSDAAGAVTPSAPARPAQ